jgi:hypothetical protein
MRRQRHPPGVRTRCWLLLGCGPRRATRALAGLYCAELFPGCAEPAVRAPTQRSRWCSDNRGRWHARRVRHPVHPQRHAPDRKRCRGAAAAARALVGQAATPDPVQLACIEARRLTQDRGQHRGSAATVPTIDNSLTRSSSACVARWPSWRSAHPDGPSRRPGGPCVPAELSTSHRISRRRTGTR